MGCPKCQEENANLPPSVLEIVNKEKTVLFHKVVRNANLGDDTAENGTPPDQLNYKNVLLVYEANNHAYLYSSDGAYTFISMGELDVDKIMELLRQHGIQIEELQDEVSTLQSGLAEETQNRTQADENLQNSINTNTQEITDLITLTTNQGTKIATNTTNITNLTDNLDGLTTIVNTNSDDISNLQGDVTTLQNDVAQNTETLTTINTNLNQNVEQNTIFTSDTSTVSVEHSRVNLYNNDKSSTTDPLPVASETQAGVMNTATFQAIQNNAESVDAILNGAIAINSIAAEPTQEALTSAWKNATGKTQLINRASIWDLDNDKVWYYYENINEWKAIPANPNGEEVTVSIFTNTTPGIIQGSIEPGQIFAEANGTGSVVGWDGMKHDVENLIELLETNPIPKLYTNYGTNTDGTVTQKFINDKLNSTSIVLGDGASKNSIPSDVVIIGRVAKTHGDSSSYAIAIGDSSIADKYCVSVGAYAQSIGLRSEATALGYGARTYNDDSVALGSRSMTGRNDEVSIGHGDKVSEGPSTRYIANVTAGELDTDAVNVKQLNDGLATKISTTDFMTTAEFNAAWEAA